VAEPLTLAADNYSGTRFIVAYTSSQELESDEKKPATFNCRLNRQCKRVCYNLHLNLLVNVVSHLSLMM
jgi:hypothetical protein